MKKALIGTTALVAGGLIAGSALAADLIPAPAPEIIDDGFTVTWSGYIRSGIYFGDNNEDDLSDPDNDGVLEGDRSAAPAGGIAAGDPENINSLVPIVAELQLFATQTLANGLTVGGEIDMDLDQVNSDDLQIDELWIFMRGHFGQVRFGHKENALSTLAGGALPTWGRFAGTTDGPDLDPVQTISTRMNAGTDEEVGDSDANKVTYLSPTLHGINLGVSFTPDPDQEDGTNSNELDINGNTNNGWINEWSVGANATHNWGDTRLLVSGGFTFAEAEKSNTTQGDAFIWKLAGSIRHSWGGVGAYYNVVEFDQRAGSLSSTDETATMWGVQGNIIHGDYTWGAGYSQSEDDKFLGGASDETQIIAGGVSRKLGTGTEVGVNFVHFDDDPGTQGACAANSCDIDSEGWLAGFYGAITF